MMTTTELATKVYIAEMRIVHWREDGPDAVSTFRRQQLPNLLEEDEEVQRVRGSREKLMN